MILYAGEILGMEDYNVTRYKVFKTYTKALDWCMENANFRTRTVEGKPRSVRAYDKNRCNGADYYSDDRCSYKFFLWGYFAVREIEI